MCDFIRFENHRKRAACVLKNLKTAFTCGRIWRSISAKIQCSILHCTLHNLSCILCLSFEFKLAIQLFCIQHSTSIYATCWMLHVVSVCTSFYMLLGVVGSCCVRLFVATSREGHLGLIVIYLFKAYARNTTTEAPSTSIRFCLKTEIFFLEFGLPSTHIRWKRAPKTHLFKNALQNEYFWKRRFWICMGIQVKYFRDFSWNTPFQMRQSVGQHSPPSKTVQRHPGDRPCSICCRRVSTSGLSGVEKVSLVHSTGKSLDRLSTTIWVGVGQVNWAHDLHRSLTSGLKLNSKSWMSNVETCKYNVQSRMSEAKT